MHTLTLEWLVASRCRWQMLIELIHGSVSLPVFPVRGHTQAKQKRLFLEGTSASRCMTTEALSALYGQLERSHWDLRWGGLRRVATWYFLSAVDKNELEKRQTSTWGTLICCLVVISQDLHRIIYVSFSLSIQGNWIKIKNKKGKLIRFTFKCGIWFAVKHTYTHTHTSTHVNKLQPTQLFLWIEALWMELT